VRPGAGRTAVLGERAGALRLAVAAPPEKGKANKVALRFLARALNLSRAGLELASGETSRRKVILCRGTSAEELEVRLAGLIAEGSGRS
jgi:uncharacterized protein YggU (UPF0235/DUF167 family)